MRSPVGANAPRRTRCTLVMAHSTLRAAAHHFEQRVFEHGTTHRTLQARRMDLGALVLGKVAGDRAVAQAALRRRFLCTLLCSAAQRVRSAAPGGRHRWPADTVAYRGVINCPASAFDECAGLVETLAAAGAGEARVVVRPAARLAVRALDHSAALDAVAGRHALRRLQGRHDRRSRVKRHAMRTTHRQAHLLRGARPCRILQHPTRLVAAVAQSGTGDATRRNAAARVPSPRCSSARPCGGSCSRTAGKETGPRAQQTGAVAPHSQHT